MPTADDDRRTSVGPLLRRLVGTPSRRRWARRLLGLPVVVARWLATRDDVTHEQVHREAPSSEAPALSRFADAQLPSDGVGPGIHRTYRVRVPGCGDEARGALARLAAEPNLHCTLELGHFESDDGQPDVAFAAGRQLRVELTGPYDGPVSVVEQRPTRVRLQTRQGHIEAGQILFDVEDEDGDLVFTIASWTRSSSRIVDVLYRTGPARWAQQHMWVTMCRQLARGVGLDDPTVGVRTEWLPADVAQLGEHGAT